MKQTQTRAYNVRASEKPLVIEGTAVVFDKPADMGGYTEYIAKSRISNTGDSTYRYTPVFARF